MAMTNVNPKPQKEETQVAPPRSSSVGRALGRLFSKSPILSEPRSASTNSPNVHPTPIMDSNEHISQAPAQLAGPRGRSPPINSVATICASDQPPEGPPETFTSSPLPQQHNLPLGGASYNPQFGRVIPQPGVIRSDPYPAMAMSHRGQGAERTDVGDGWLSQLRPARPIQRAREENVEKSMPTSACSRGASASRPLSTVTTHDHTTSNYIGGDQMRENLGGRRHCVKCRECDP